MIYAKAENWPVLCYYDRIKCAKFQVFLKLSTWVSQPAKYARKWLFWAQNSLWAPYLIIVDQIQLKLVSTLIYLDKVLLQSIVAALDFLLSSCNSLKMWKKSIKVVNLTILHSTMGAIFKILAKNFLIKSIFKMSQTAMTQCPG